ARMSRNARGRAATATKGRTERMPALDALVTTALVGTSHTAPPAQTATPIDALTDAMAAWSQIELERQLLLRAGALAVWRQAGQTALQVSTVVQPHAPEALQECSLAVTTLLRQLFTGEHQDLLPEALERLHA